MGRLFPIRLIDRLRGNVKILELDFGFKGLEKLIEVAQRERKTAEAVLLDEIITKMEELGYSRTSIGRAIFEDALDHQTGIELFKVRQALRVKKCPKYLRFKISVPKRE